MKALISTMAFLVSLSAFGYMTGDKIHFQKDSTWVNSYYNKSLCLNDQDVYEAVVSVCTKYVNNGSDDRTCVRRGTKKIYQPMVSTRLRCDDWSGDNCSSWVRVDYVQSPKRTVKFYNDKDQLTKTASYTIKSCN